jgi:hypothetical protein
VAQPDYVPLSTTDKVRAPERLPVPESWRPDRPAEFKGNRRTEGPRLGTPGPDQGYALKLARQFDKRLELAPGEHAEDAVAGCLGVALKRAALFGRAPVVYDLELAFSLFGYLGGAPIELVQFRKPLFQSAAHHYWDQRGIVDRVPDDTLRLTPVEVRDRLTSWRDLLDTE